MGNHRPISPLQSDSDRDAIRAAALMIVATRATGGDDERAAAYDRLRETLPAGAPITKAHLQADSAAAERLWRSVAPAIPRVRQQDAA